MKKKPFGRLERPVGIALSSLVLASCNGDDTEVYSAEGESQSNSEGGAEPGASPGVGEQGADEAADSSGTGPLDGERESTGPDGPSGTGTNEGGSSGSSGPAVNLTSNMPSGPGASEPPLSPIFSETEVQRYALQLDPVVWQRLQAEAIEQDYAEAELDVGGQHLSRVGLRFKGSLGTLASCLAPDGTRTCAKLSMKLKFNEYLPEQRLSGLKRLNFNSMVRDPSQLRERVAYRVFREMGLPTPRAVHARLSVNGEDQGLFTLVEDVDGRFTDERFAGGGDGNLYKEQWPTTADAARLDERLEAGPDIVDHGALLRFRADLAAATLPAALPEVVARYMDIDQVLAHLAVARAIHDWDGVMTFLCPAVGPCENHNFFLYQHEGEPRFSLIPWDVDRVFELEPPLPAMPDVFGPVPDCSVTYPDADGVLIAPGCEPLLRGAVGAGPDRVAAQLERLLAGPFAPGVIESWLDTWQAQIEPEVMTDSRGPGLDEFRRALLDLRLTVVELRDQAGR
jgi:spore coat protein H